MSCETHLSGWMILWALTLGGLGSATIAGDLLDTRQALSREQQAEAKYYRTLRNSRDAGPAAQLRARSQTVGPGLAALSEARGREIEGGLAKYGLKRGSLKEVHTPTSVDRELGAAGLEAMLKNSAPNSSEARRIAGLTGEVATPAKRPPAGPSPRPAEPEPVLDGDGIPRYLQFRGKKK